MIITNELVFENEYTSIKTTGREKFPVYFKPHMNGGGIHFHNHYVDMMNKRYHNRKFHTCFEWCAGPAFIGFDILDHGFCEHLYLTDVYKPSLDTVSKTISETASLAQRVTTQLAGKIADIPDHVKFDLVVSNPPHFKDWPEYRLDVNGKDGDPNWNDPNQVRIGVDPDWQIHKEFFANIGRHLDKDGVIILLEHAKSKSDVELLPFIKDQFHYDIEYDNHKYYYLTLTKK